MPTTSTVTCADLAARQLDAYNARDLDGFCACYADDVTVLDADGAVTIRGIADFRERYGAMFAAWDDVGAAVDVREDHGEARGGAHGDEVIDHERWWRSRGDERASGRVRVRYVARDGRIAVVQFFREDA